METNSRFGDTYQDRGQIDHDTALLLRCEIIDTLVARGVPWADAIASVRRVARGEFGWS